MKSKVMNIWKSLIVASTLVTCTASTSDCCEYEDACCRDDKCFFGWFDALIWKGTRNHMDYAIKGDNSNGSGLIEDVKR